MTVLEPVVQFLMGYRGKKVTLDQVIAGAERPRRPVIRVMDRLVREGNLEEIADEPFHINPSESGRARRNPTWRILVKPLVEDFKPKKKKITERDRMWILIRARRRFTRSEMMRLTGVSLGSATDYTRMLVRDGYLREIGNDGHQKVFMLVKDPGPKRPVVKEKIDD